MFFVEFQLHFDKDYSTTAWIHSLIDSTTMLCGKNRQYRSSEAGRAAVGPDLAILFCSFLT